MIPGTCNIHVYEFLLNCSFTSYLPASAMEASFKCNLKPICGLKNVNTKVNSLQKLLLGVEIKLL